MVMGIRVSVQKNTCPAMKLKFSINSQENSSHFGSPVKDRTVNGDHSMPELDSKPRSLSPLPCHQASFEDLDNREMFLDSHPWLESDCEDYLSVNGDFTPSCGATPIHQGSFRETPPCEESLCIINAASSIPEPSSTDMRKQLIEFFQENISSDPADNNQNFSDTVDSRPITVYLPPKCTNRRPYESVASPFCSSETKAERSSKPEREKSTHSARCCLPNIVRSLSFSERKKRLNPTFTDGRYVYQRRITNVKISVNHPREKMSSLLIWQAVNHSLT